MDEGLLKAIAEAASKYDVGFWQLVAALCVVVFVWRLPDLARVLSEFFNERRRIRDEMRLKQERTARSLEAAKKRRERAVLKK